MTRKGEDGLERKYTDFYSVPVYRGIATGYAIGLLPMMLLLLVTLVQRLSRKIGKYYSPRQAAQMLFKAAEQGITYSDYWRKIIRKIDKLRLSGCEPTIGKEHPLSLLQYVEWSKYKLFILEANGIILGNDKDYVKRLSEFKDRLYVRVSIKAATPESFTQRIGAMGEFYTLPFQALKKLLDEGIYVRQPP